MSDVTVIVPVLNRPERVTELVESVYASQRDLTLRLLFVANDDDHQEVAAIRETPEDLMLIPPRQPGDYARKVNRAARMVRQFRDSEWVFVGADDLCFCPGWADEAVRVGERHKKRVVGTNDLGNALVMAGRHATHHLVHLSYLDDGTVDEPGKLLHEGYDHQFVDTEMVATAQARGEWVFAHNAQVEHLHFLWRKAPHDSTYELGQRRTVEDARLFQERMRLWEQRDISHAP